MKNLFIICLLIGVVACDGGTEKNPKATSNSFDAIAHQWLEATGIPSVSYVIIEDGEITHSNALGFANCWQGSPVSEDTYYNSGSNWKAFTATAIMQLYEAGVIDIDADINDYLRSPIKHYNDSIPITARHLMSHRSGLHESVDKARLWCREDLPTIQDLKEAIVPVSPPGELYRYSNDGYTLLGILIEDVTGETYENYMWEHVLKPLGICTSGFLKLTPYMVERLALPYHMRFNEAFPTHQVQLAQFPAGDVYLTPKEMSRFLLMHLNSGKYSGTNILRPESIESMHSPAVEVVEGFDYGLGFGIETIDGKTYSTHQGSLPGYLSSFRIDRENGNGVYLATNVSAARLQEEQINWLLDAFMGMIEGDQDELTSIPRDSERTSKTIGSDPAKFTGTYSIVGHEVYLEIRLFGDDLYLINPAGERFLMALFDNDRFFLTTENEDIEFMEENGKIVSLRLYSKDSEITAIKIEE